MITLVTPSTDFEAQVKRALGGELDGVRHWDTKGPRLDPRDAAERLVPPGSTVVVLGPNLDTDDALAMARHLDLVRPEACVILVATPSPNLWEQALRAGVRDVLEPGSSDEVVGEAIGLAASAAGRRAVVAATVASKPAATARVVTVVSSKGGSGKTTVATNLAIGLAKLAPGEVVIVDLDLQFGDVPTCLQLRPRTTIANLARETGAIGATAVKALLESHPSGLYAMCGPDTPAEAEEVGVGLVGRVLDVLAAEFKYVVVDTAAGLNEFALAALDRSTDVILVGATDVPTVKGLRKVVAVLDLLGVTGRRHFLLNRSNARVGLGTRDIEATVGLPVSVAVPSTRTIPVALNQGSPVLESNHKSPAAGPLAEVVSIVGSGSGSGSDTPEDAATRYHWGSRERR